MAGSGHSYDPNFTQNCIDAIGPKASPRTREVMGALLRHIHDFAREVELTTDEWLAGVRFVNSIGQISDNTRNEAHRVSDIIGLESLVDEIAHKHVNESGQTPTSSTILGPFWSPRAPFRNNGESIIESPHSGQVALMHGKVVDMVTGRPIPGAVVDIWQASSNGKYDFQDPENQVDNNLRGKFRSNEKGEYHFYCLKPTAYTLPTDGPAGVLFDLLDRSPWRPAHIHLMISHDDYSPVVTQLYPKGDPHLHDDSVFAVKPDLVVDFKPRQGDPKAELDLHYDIKLAPRDSKSASVSRL
ncbi:Intradiol ring-cleavage dioxygenase [Lineolata rhizophorae]|uniref:Intradiol ring-cleavage dioxygenase n=1 Tax=Lineolata rhizophorae TaxID=578093 RepID=A0A6A6NW65_9PEZI|nr:Intradiol ring-cleavage dioxygenase [Lineolata rhizophorae]